MKKHNPIVLMIYGLVFGVMISWTQYFFRDNLVSDPISGIIEHGTFSGLLIGVGAGLAFCLLLNLELSIKSVKYSRNIKSCKRALQKEGIDYTGLKTMLGFIVTSILVWFFIGSIGAIIISIVCFFGGIKQDKQSFMMKLCWLTGAIIPLLVLLVGMRQNRIFSCAQTAMVAVNERETKEREQEAFVQRTSAYLNSFFTHNGKPLFYLQEILQYIEANSNNPIYRKVVLSEIRNYETRIYDDFISALANKDFQLASSGMQLLCDVFPEKEEYMKALDRLRDKRKLLAVMEQNGLPESSPQMNRYTDTLD